MTFIRNPRHRRPKPTPAPKPAFVSDYNSHGVPIGAVSFNMAAGKPPRS